MRRKLAVFAIAAAASLAGDLSADRGAALFAKFKSLAGEWNAASTQGWEGTMKFEVIASGSAVLHVSHMAAHDSEAMATLFHRDGPAVVMTHYCVAGNQPHLKATDFDGREAAFDFVRATNLRTPEAGHMHRVRYQFLDADHFESQWTWRQNGKEQWLETIQYSRKK